MPQYLKVAMETANVEKLLQSASQKTERGDLEAGLRELEQVLAIQPGNAPALDLAARVYLSQGKATLAFDLANRAVAVQAIVPFVVTLAEALKAKGDTQKAAEYFQKVLQKVPKETRALAGLGEIYELADYRNHAVSCYKALLKLQPSNLAIAIRFSNLCRIPDLPEGMAAVERARPPPTSKPLHQLSYLSHAVFYKEWTERAKRGLMPYHVTRMDELFFHYAAADLNEYEAIADRLLAENPDMRAGISSKADSLFTKRRRHEAEPFYHRVAKDKPDSVYASIEFSQDFFRRISRYDEAKLEEGLPPLIEAVPQNFSGDHVIYLSCNYGYFVDFARTMLLSIDATSQQAQIHLHLMDASDADIDSAKAFCSKLTKTQIAISVERPNVSGKDAMAARCYYHAIRFIRLLRHLKHYNKTLWLMDVDALIHQDPRTMFAGLGNADTAFRARPGRWEPWNQFNASVMAIRPTERGRTYLHLIAGYVADFYQRGKLRWGIDQLAMYAAYEHLNDEGQAPVVHFLDDRAVDYECFDDGYVWCNSGRAKFGQLQMIAKGMEESKDPVRAKYFNALKIYAARLK